MNRTINEKLEALRQSLVELGDDWGSSDQYAMDKSVHDSLGKPKSPPTLSRVMDAAESAVDFYWNDWSEYRSNHKGLVMQAARSYYRRFFPEFWDSMGKLFAPR